MSRESSWDKYVLEALWSIQKQNNTREFGKLVQHGNEVFQRDWIEENTSLKIAAREDGDVLPCGLEGRGEATGRPGSHPRRAPQQGRCIDPGELLPLLSQLLSGGGGGAPLREDRTDGSRNARRSGLGPGVGRHDAGQPYHLLAPGAAGRGRAVALRLDLSTPPRHAPTRRPRGGYRLAEGSGSSGSDSPPLG